MAIDYKTVTLESITYETIMTITNDFILANILPKHTLVKIHTCKDGDRWISKIHYR